MKDTVSLTNKRWSYGSYQRSQQRDDVLYNFVSYDDIVVSMRCDAPMLADTLAEALLQHGLTDTAHYTSYLADAAELAANPLLTDASVEDVYNYLHQLRLQHFGSTAVAQYYSLQQAETLHNNEHGINFATKQQQLMQQKTAIIYLLTDRRYYVTMQQEALGALEVGKRVYLLTSFAEGFSLPTKDELAPLLAAGAVAIPMLHTLACPDLSALTVDDGLCAALQDDDVFLSGYGEKALLAVKQLCIPAIVQTVTTGLYACAVTNAFCGNLLQLLYVPVGFCIFDTVTLTATTSYSYYHMYLLYQKLGEELFELSVAEQRQHFPELFLDPYDDSFVLPPVLPNSKNTTPEALRILLTQQLLTAHGGQYLHSYFSASDCQPFSGTPRQGQLAILVDAVLIDHASGAMVLSPVSADYPRTLLSSCAQSHTGIFSNFLFFITPAITNRYNLLRVNRPQEQIKKNSGHMDFMFVAQSDQQMQTFPLYNKPCLAMRRDGSFVAFAFSLGGGELTLLEQCFVWTAEDVDPVNPGLVAVYRPNASRGAQYNDPYQYTLPVGAGRLNLVIIDNQVVVIRQGTVLQPCIGVVLSLTGTAAQTLLQHLESGFNGDGYYQGELPTLQLHLQPPAELGDTGWQDIVWAYGGGLTLIRGGKDMVDDSCWNDQLEQEGWLCPLSMQTQESALHIMARHPRTTVCVTKDGKLGVLVFSGRTPLTVGADYREMCHIARQLLPDIDTMINLDGGGSSVLGLVGDGRVMELSYPSSSDTNCVGMARKMNTIFYLELQSCK